MSRLDVVFTSKPLGKTVFTLGDVYGSDAAWISEYGEAATSIEFTDKGFTKEEEHAMGDLFPGFKRYIVHKRIIEFDFNEGMPRGRYEIGVKGYTWLLERARKHIRDGVTEYYYASLWYCNDPDVKKPNHERVVIDEWKAKTEFRLKTYTIYEFVNK